MSVRWSACVGVGLGWNERWERPGKRILLWEGPGVDLSALAGRWGVPGAWTLRKWQQNCCPEDITHLYGVSGEWDQAMRC